jgi:predicted alpha/beta superfamily hydrolase
MKSSISLFVLLLISFFTKAQLSKVSAGKLIRVDSFVSTYIPARTIDIWLPAGYSNKKKYAVLYMHDGQMLYDPETSWNKQAWQVDDVLQRLMNEGKIKDVIVVGIWNTGDNRHAEYFPQKPYESLLQTQKDTLNAQLRSAGGINEVFKPVSNNYLKFIVNELKPFIDQNYFTNTSSNNTFIAGSSMGGLISIYAICEYPEVFGGAACLSTHWPGMFTLYNNPIPQSFYDYLHLHLPDPNNHKIYFDYGNKTLDSMYEPLQKKVDIIMKAKGYSEKNWRTYFFNGASHTENDWSKRFDIPMLFILE